MYDLLNLLKCLGNWMLHLKATQDMLPGFAAAGHNNYTRCFRLYLQGSQELCPCLARPMQEGWFTIRQNEEPFWSGTWSDMTIDQCLMRAGKTHGGLMKEGSPTRKLHGRSGCCLPMAFFLFNFNSTIP